MVSPRFLVSVIVALLYDHFQATIESWPMWATLPCALMAATAWTYIFIYTFWVIFSWGVGDSDEH